MSAELIARFREAAATGKPGCWNMLATSELYAAADLMEAQAQQLKNQLDLEMDALARSRDALFNTLCRISLSHGDSTTSLSDKYRDCVKQARSAILACRNLGHFEEQPDGTVTPVDPVDMVKSFQARVKPWLLECFGEVIAGDREERNHRFLEESLELVQSLGCTASEAHQLVDYVYGRPWGDPFQEVGGVMVTLAALCSANGLDMHTDGETELARIWTKVAQIRAKQAGKPKHSPLPEETPNV